MNLDGKVALVTGGSGDIGGAIARRLGKAGAHVVVADVGAEDAAAATVCAIVDAGGSASAEQLDQRSPQSIEACVRHIAEVHRRLDIPRRVDRQRVARPLGPVGHVLQRCTRRCQRAPMHAALIAALVLAACTNSAPQVSDASKTGVIPTKPARYCEPARSTGSHIPSCRRAESVSPEELEDMTNDAAGRNTGGSQ